MDGSLRFTIGTIPAYSRRTRGVIIHGGVLSRTRNSGSETKYKGASQQVSRCQPSYAYPLQRKAITPYLLYGQPER